MAESTLKRPFLPPRWVIRFFWRIHRAVYRTSNGRMGLRPPTPDRFGLMKLTATGRQTGQERSVMLAYVDDGPNVVTLAMNGWGPDEPAWWLNLQAEPSVEIELVDGTRPVTGRVANSDEQDRLWPRWGEVIKDLDAFAASRPTETPVVILEPR